MTHRNGPASTVVLEIYATTSSLYVCNSCLMKSILAVDWWMFIVFIINCLFDFLKLIGNFYLSFCQFYYLKFMNYVYFLSTMVHFH